MTDRPILFSGPMVRALLAGRKTQTRRVLSNERFASLFNGTWANEYVLDPGNQSWRDSEIRYSAGDRLWVRESLSVASNDQGVRWLSYAADGKDVWPTTQWHKERNSVPSIHMPRWASRLTLPVVDVRVQRLQDISEEDALAEGVPTEMEGNIGDEIYCSLCEGNGVHAAFGAGYGVTEVDCAECATAVQRFRNLWNGINAARGYGWDANPWVTAVTVTVEHRNIDQVAP
ncbi:hypothetical protein [Rhizobiales bacterium 3FA27D7]|jgi:hypothetical protein|uniref:hypothetical protein n=1 Tax=Mesorhizobium sp. 2RAF21 TaxID=3232995 RepID=UPI0010F8299F